MIYEGSLIIIYLIQIINHFNWIKTNYEMVLTFKSEN